MLKYFPMRLQIRVFFFFFFHKKKWNEKKIHEKKGKFNFECAQLLNIKWNPIHNGTLSLYLSLIPESTFWTNFYLPTKWMILVFVVGKLGRHSRCVFDNTIKKSSEKAEQWRNKDNRNKENEWKGQRVGKRKEERGRNVAISGSIVL